MCWLLGAVFPPGCSRVVVEVFGELARDEAECGGFAVCQSYIGGLEHGLQDEQLLPQLAPTPLLLENSIGSRSFTVDEENVVEFAGGFDPEVCVAKFFRLLCHGAGLHADRKASVSLTSVRAGLRATQRKIWLSGLRERQGLIATI
jgi:hypothetical protein